MKLQRLNALLVGCFALLAKPAAAVDYSSPSLTVDVYAGVISSNEIAKKTTLDDDTGPPEGRSGHPAS